MMCVRWDEEYAVVFVYYDDGYGWQNIFYFIAIYFIFSTQFIVF